VVSITYHLTKYDLQDMLYQDMEYLSWLEGWELPTTREEVLARFPEVLAWADLVIHAPRRPKPRMPGDYQLCRKMVRELFPELCPTTPFEALALADSAGEPHGGRLGLLHSTRRCSGLGSLGSDRDAA
jgi:hypothetical protein